MVLDALFKIIQTLASIAKTTISTAFSSPVSHFLGIAKTLLLVLYDLFEVTQSPLSIARISVRISFSSPVSQCFGTAKMLPVVIYLSFYHF